MFLLTHQSTKVDVRCLWHWTETLCLEAVTFLVVTVITVVLASLHLKVEWSCMFFVSLQHILEFTLGGVVGVVLGE